jgi:hypothetical protein
MAAIEGPHQFVAQVTVIVPTSAKVEGIAFEASLGPDGKLYSVFRGGGRGGQKSGNIAVQIMQMAIERMIESHLAEAKV